MLELGRRQNITGWKLNRLIIIIIIIILFI